MRGFTLLEAILYTALLGLIMTGALMAAYSLVEGAGRTNSQTVLAEEGAFVLHKLQWATTGLSSISGPALGTCAGTLQVQKIGIGTIDVRLTGSTTEIQVAGAGYVPITTQNVQVSGLQFCHLSGAAEGVGASTTIHGTVFSLVKYIRN